MNTNVTSGFFSSEDVDFTLRFPGIIKKHAAGRRTFSVASRLKTRIHIILHCKTFIPITQMTISFTSASRARAPFDRCFVILVPRAPVSFGHVVGETEGSGRSHYRMSEIF